MRPIITFQDTVLPASLKDPGLKKAEIYTCGCGEQHEAGDTILEVEFQGQVWNNNCLLQKLVDYRSKLQKMLVQPKAILGSSYKPVRAPNGVHWCGLEQCGLGYSKLQDGGDYCVQARRRTAIGDNPLCLFWIRQLVSLIRE